MVAALGNNPIIVDPHVAVASEHIDVRARLPVGVGLAAVRIAKGQVHAGEFLVLKQNADHFREAKVGAESQFADAVIEEMNA